MSGAGKKVADAAIKSGAGKKVADAAIKAASASGGADKALATIDWDGMAKVMVSDDARKEFNNLRRTYEDVNHQLRTKFSLEPEPIDWEFYRKGLGSRLVDMYKSAYDSVKIPKFEETVQAEYKPKFEVLALELQKAMEESIKRSEKIDKELADVLELKEKICSMTAEEYFQKYPELKKKFDDEIRNDIYGW